MFLGLNLNILNIWGKQKEKVVKKSEPKKVEKIEKPSFKDVYTSLLDKELKR